jgi:hypothetical protein
MPTQHRAPPGRAHRPNIGPRRCEQGTRALRGIPSNSMATAKVGHCAALWGAKWTTSPHCLRPLRNPRADTRFDDPSRFFVQFGSNSHGQKANHRHLPLERLVFEASVETRPPGARGERRKLHDLRTQCEAAPAATRVFSNPNDREPLSTPARKTRGRTRMRPRSRIECDWGAMGLGSARMHPARLHLRVVNSLRVFDWVLPSAQLTLVRVIWCGSRLA